NRDRVLVLDKVSGGYTGLTFPGGHVEVGESFTDAMKREVYEETGLTVDRLHFEGVFNWTQPEGKRYVIFFYRTQCFSGELKASDEGQLRWVPWQEFMNMKLANHMDYALKLLFDRETTEVFLDRTDPTNKDIALK
ncbi:MAG: NUDIX domain-containing protein, partial [Clostridia bacterium]|nr:NUDIX domain-containing protein [Clostridia bacterium]